MKTLVMLSLVGCIVVGHDDAMAEDAVKTVQVKTPKPMTLLIYMVNNNNLNQRGEENVKQMLQVGSTPYINVLLQMDDFGQTTSSRYVLHQGGAERETAWQSYTLSGSAANFYDFMKWGITQYPAQSYAILLWNHGSGIKDMAIWGRLFLKHRDEFVILNPATGLFEFDRKKAQGRILKLYDQERGIAYNDATHEYLTNSDLTTVFDRVTSELLNGKKIDIVIFDACLMQMLEIGTQIRSYVRYMVGSENVAPSTGYDYLAVLRPLMKGAMSPFDFSRHIVDSYAMRYTLTHSYYTHSVVDLSNFFELEQNVNVVAECLLSLMSTQKYATTIKKIRESRITSTEFDDEDYIDLLHFYKSLLVSCGHMKNFEVLQGTQEKVSIFGFNSNKKEFERLKDTLKQGIKVLEATVLRTCSGRQFPGASGLSIYFPRHRIHQSYPRTMFALRTKWLDFLRAYQALPDETSSCCCW